VRTENLIRIELMMKSRHVGGDDRLDFAFNVQRHPISRSTLRQFRNEANGIWRSATAAA
jgi:hypothetical protein